MFTVIAEYVTIYLLAKKTIVTSSIDVFDPVRVVSNVKTPYSLIITTIAMLFKSSIIVHLMGKIRSLPEDSPVNNETLPPPYQSLSNVASTQNNPYTTTTTRRPGSRSTTQPQCIMGHPTQRNPFFLNPEKCSQITMEIIQWSGHYRMPRHITTRLTKDPTNHDPQLLHKWYSLETYLLTKGSTLSGYNSRDRTSSHLYKTVLGL